MESNDVLGNLQGYTIMTGVMKLVQADLWLFAAVIFCASVFIPLLKLFAFAWFGMSIYHRSASRLRLKTKLYRIIDVVGRWSHIDVFTVSVFLPLMQLNGLLNILVGRALPAFLAVVVLTMLATSLFDPRTLWRAAERRV
jgi:paraquat-inducible protein A